MAIPHPRRFSVAIAQRSSQRVAQKLTQLAKAKGLFGARYGTSTYLTGAMAGPLFEDLTDLTQEDTVPLEDTL